MTHKLLILIGCCVIILTESVFPQPPAPYGALPSPRQLAWQETDMYCIIHFSTATYTDKEWGYGNEDPKIFNPSNFNALQILGAAKAGGLNGVVVVAKHHDGFCLWPTKTTDHNISNSPYKNGHGDIVQEYKQACEKLGMKMGIYCSPWDRNNSFYGEPKYVTDIYREQLKELYSNYGNLFMSWHDGANGGDGYYGGANETRKIDRSTYYGWDSTWALTRAMQPGACIFGDVGPDVRWVGNERGFAGETYWATYTPEAPEPGKKPANGFSKYEAATEGIRNGKFWIPAECDVPLRPGWFYHASQDGQTKTPFELLNIYYKSVGRGACLDLGLSPNKDGVLAEEDVNALARFGKIIKTTFTYNLAAGSRLVASNERKNDPQSSISNLLDDDRYSYWATDDSVHEPELVIYLDGSKTFNVIRLRENITLGQRVEAFGIDVWKDTRWQTVAEETSIGPNKLIKIPRVTTDRVRLRITRSPVCVALSDFGLFTEPEILTPVEMNRSKAGMVTLINKNQKGEIRYSTDGKNPTGKSEIFKAPFPLREGGMVKAAIFLDSSAASETTFRRYGFGKSGWKIMSPTGGQPGKVIDENPETFAVFSDLGDSKSLPELLLDLGVERMISAITYLPRQDKTTEGMVTQYSVSLSEDGQTWETVANGEFSNIQSNPVEQMIRINKLSKARYLKFSPKSVLGKKHVFTMAEIGVFGN